MSADSNKPTILVVDRGAFLPFAQGLTKDANVLYFSEWREIAAQSRNAMVGRDIPGMQRVDSMWKFIDEVDTICFPDVGDGDLQMWLRKKGYSVWGSGDSEMLELLRWDFKQLLEKLGLPVVEARHVVGLEALKPILQEEDDRYIKLSVYRGDGETFHHVNWDLTLPWFREMQHRLGPHGDEAEFVVEMPVKAFEIGYDGYCIDGQFPQHAEFGVEVKDQGYIGRNCAASLMPRCIREVNNAVAEALHMLGMRGNFTTEIRVAEDGTAYFTDPTCRCPAPPSAVQSVAITNWVEIVTAGARGELVEPEFAAEYVAEVELSTPWVEHEWCAIEMPAGIEDRVRFRRACVVDGRYWCIPSTALDIIGSAIGLGDTPEEAIEEAVSVAEQVQALQLTYNKNIKQELIEGWQRACELPVEDD